MSLVCVLKDGSIYRRHGYDIGDAQANIKLWEGDIPFNPKLEPILPPPEVVRIWQTNPCGGIAPWQAIKKECILLWWLE